MELLKPVELSKKKENTLLNVKIFKAVLNDNILSNISTNISKNRNAPNVVQKYDVKM